MRRFKVRQYLPLVIFVLLPISVSLAVRYGTPSPTPEEPKVNTYIIKSLKPLTVSNNENVVWPSIRSVDSIDSYKFYCPETPKTINDVKKLSPDDWQDRLPRTVAFNSNLRSLWVQVFSKAGLKLDEPFIDLTATSAIKAIKSVIPTSAYASVDISGAVINISDSGEYKVANIPTPPAFTKILFSIPSESVENLDTWTLEKYLTQVYPNDLTGTKIPPISIYLSASDESKYILSVNKSALVKVVPSATRLQK